MLRIMLPLLLASAPAAAEVAAVQTVQKELVIVDKDGREKIVRKTADRAKPGEQVIYALRYENVAGGPAEGMTLVMPVPGEITYVEGSITGPRSNVTFSADGGATYVARGRLSVTQAGKARPATNTDITHIKWTLAEPLAASEKGEVSFRGIVK